MIYENIFSFVLFVGGNVFASSVIKQ
jgi:hypothetical protein